MDEPDLHAAVAASALRHLGRKGDLDVGSIRLLAGGLSGAAVYGFALSGEPMVLKITPPDVAAGLLERARREALFYRDLAPRVPVQVPRLLGSTMDAGRGVAVLLEAHAPAPPAAEWPDGDFAEVARQLGELHAAFWGATPPSALPGWLPLHTAVTPDRCQRAAHQWRAPGEQTDRCTTIGPVLRQIDQMLDHLPALDLRHANLPITLCHGDFHADNLLRSANGDWLLADWQAVRLGPGVDDLAFFWQRALAASDTAPPYDTIVQAYREGLRSAGTVPISPADLDRALAWSELRLWLVEWPDYVGFLPASRVGQVMERIALLLDRRW